MGTGVTALVPVARSTRQGMIVRPLTASFCSSSDALGLWLDDLAAVAPWDSLDQADVVSRVEHALSLSVDDAVAVAWRHPDDVRAWWLRRVQGVDVEAMGNAQQEAQA